MGIYAGYHHPQGDFYPDEGDDPGIWITDDGKCSNCGYALDFDDLKALNFIADGGGVSSTPDCPPVYWAYGTIECPNCHDRLPFETSN